jgi:uncharacterized protein
VRTLLRFLKRALLVFVAAHVALGLVGLVMYATGKAPAGVGAFMIVRPFRRPVRDLPPLPHQDFQMKTDDGLTLRGWMFRPAGPARALIVYLHGKGTNRSTGGTFAERYVPKGYAVLAYDSRGHGESDGTFITYGTREGPDLRRALDKAGFPYVILVGESLGAGVALEEAPDDPRVAGVVAVAPFADLEVRIRETAGRFEPTDAMKLAEQQAQFKIADISPRKAAARIHVPVLVIHGTADTATPPHHSQEIFDALPGPRKLVWIEGSGHADILQHDESWKAIDAWLDQLP